MTDEWWHRGTAAPVTDEWADLRRLAEAATPGPWIDEHEQTMAWVHSVAGGVVIADLDSYEGAVKVDANGAFIAAANPATILRLLAERNRLAEDVAALRAAPLDVDRLTEAIHAPHNALACRRFEDRADAERIAAEYALLAQSDEAGRYSVDVTFTTADVAAKDEAGR